jgi:NNP family nitrate/nitrite transporter-like MFS transporter
MKPNTQLSLICACLVGFAFSANYTNHAPIAELLMKLFSYDKASAGFLTTGIFISHAFMQIPGGMLADKYGGKNVLLIALIVVCIGNFGITTSTSYEALLFWKIFVGFGTGTSFVSGARYIAQTIPAEKLHMSQGYYGASILLGSGFVIFILPRLVEAFGGWNYGFISTAIVATIALVVFALFAPKTQVKVIHQTNLSTLLSTQRLWLLGSVQMASFGLSIVIGSWITILLKEHLELKEKLVISFIASLVLLLGIFSRPFGGKLIKKTSVLNIVLISLLMNATGCFILSSSAITLVPAVFAIVLLGIGCGLPYSSLFNKATELFPQRAGAAMGLVNMMGIIMILIGAPLIGKIKDMSGSYSSAFVALGTFALLIAAIFYLSEKNKK